MAVAVRRLRPRRRSSVGGPSAAAPFSARVSVPRPWFGSSTPIESKAERAAWGRVTPATASPARRSGIRATAIATLATNASVGGVAAAPLGRCGSSRARSRAAAASRDRSAKRGDGRTDPGSRAAHAARTRSLEGRRPYHLTLVSAVPAHRVTPLPELALRPLRAPALQRLDRSRALAERSSRHPRCSGPPDHAQKEDGTLLVERAASTRSTPSGPIRASASSAASSARPLGSGGLRAKLDGAARRVAAGVDQAVVGDREDPGGSPSPRRRRWRCRAPPAGRPRRGRPPDPARCSRAGSRGRRAQARRRAPPRRPRSQPPRPPQGAR